jgi:glycine/D-amino acid oxidase-like deaminating enzyme
MAIRMPNDTGPAGWNSLLPVAEPAKVLDENISADWLVIGAGFAGLSAAQRLSELCPDAAIVILDATRVGEGPAGRNSGFMIDLPHDLATDNYSGKLDADRAQTQDNRRGIDFAAQMAAQFGLSQEAFSTNGKINGAATDQGHQHNLDFAAHLETMWEPFRLLDARQMHDITGTDYYQSGLFTPGSATIQPAMYVREIARGIALSGVSIFENSPVISLQRDGDWVAETPQGRVTAPRVILAVNGHLESFGHMKGRLMHVHTYASMTRALSPAECVVLGGDPNWGLTPADPMGTTVRRISGVGGERIVIRNRFTFDPSMQVSERRIARVSHDHDKAFLARFPMLRDVEMEYRWGGRLCLSLNNVQAIGELEPGLWSACCQNGLGTAKGTLAGVLAAEQAMGVGSDALERVLQSPEPKRLPPKPIATLGANIRLKWSEAKAGREM